MLTVWLVCSGLVLLAYFLAAIQTYKKEGKVSITLNELTFLVFTCVFFPLGVVITTVVFYETYGKTKLFEVKKK